IEQLVLPGSLIEQPLGFGCRFPESGPDQAQIVDEKQPDKCGISGAQAEPGQRTFEASEENGFAQGAGDVEKVVPEFEWPFDESKCVNDGARPKDANYAQSRAEIEKRRPIVER